MGGSAVVPDGYGCAPLNSQLKMMRRAVAPAFKRGTHSYPTLQNMSKPFQPTPEQLALLALRKAKKAKSPSTSPATVDEAKGHILTRKWIQLPIAPDMAVRRPVKVMTWNVGLICSL